ncbi:MULTISPECIES: nuclear transport factor 2 family protein [unclassified Rhizobium]|uniref:nuclear transport factor 2 family protein n=1 Tax=unclassified Rhizobium TaxID=2613769 RepID=UPI0007122FE3|nr:MULTISPECIES: nuclear transport factor 2 family protein [unclassified Rhizobium]KQS98120.1 hypothetical protein ASG50_23370 [Rhizobium sp. Leaf386]KQT00383.1 hypothetical protein ASG42_05960 [Rhizobium sp. Leaf391]KQT97386.1 hypothetical protein ASG68_10690 [Rhizobium sp. Leaf453]
MFNSVEEIVRASFDCYLTSDRSRMESLLAADFSFTSPYDDHIDRLAYFDRCWPAAGTFETLDLLLVDVCEEHCFVLYDATWKNGKTARNTELFTISHGQIQSVEVFFGLPPGGPVSGPPA